MEMIGLWSLLTEEQRSAALAYEGDVTFGAVEFLRKKAAPVMEAGKWKCIDGFEGY